MFIVVGGGHDLPVLPAERREQLYRGVGGGNPVHRLQARQQGRHTRPLRGSSGQETYGHCCGSGFAWIQTFFLDPDPVKNYKEMNSKKSNFRPVNSGLCVL